MADVFFVFASNFCHIFVLQQPNTTEKYDYINYVCTVLAQKLKKKQKKTSI